MMQSAAIFELIHRSFSVNGIKLYVSSASREERYYENRTVALNDLYCHIKMNLFGIYSLAKQ